MAPAASCLAKRLAVESAYSGNSFSELTRSCVVDLVLGRSFILFS